MRFCATLSRPSRTTDDGNPDGGDSNSGNETTDQNGSWEKGRNQENRPEAEEVIREAVHAPRARPTPSVVPDTATADNQTLPAPHCCRSALPEIPST